jgi:hypothetical protein
MQRFVFFTRTRWHEPPRLRHQLSLLLVNAGYEVFFFETPRYLWQRLFPPNRQEEPIILLQHRAFIHHKLCLSSLLHFLNAFVVKHSLNPSIRRIGIKGDETIVNFNYDYWFLRDIFPKNRIITVINDDFVSGALFGYTRPLLRALERTCSSSDRVLTVSVPLQRQLSNFCQPELFFPWADCAYHKPERCTKRDTLLFWGYINDRIDFQTVCHMADILAVERSHIRLLFSGPTAKGSGYEVELLRARSNIEILPAAELDDLPVSRVLAGLIPYRSNVPSLDVITLPNKALQFLARGLPLLITGMPHFIRKPFVIRFDIDTVVSTIDALSFRFEYLQTIIEEFVSDNGPSARLVQFIGPDSDSCVVS